jgi:TfoX/Sxy family transcriptional regulator of competence genes
MASMKWIRPSQATLDYFERLAPGAPLETRRMFGAPCRFLNGYMLVGVFQNSLMLHLSESDRAECIAAGAEPFKPMGREMQAYVAITPGTFADHDLKWWIVRGMRYLGSLEPRIAVPKAPRMPTYGAPSAKAKPKKGKAKAKAKAKKAPAKAKRATAKSVKKEAPRRVTKKAARKARFKAARKAAKHPAVSRKKRPAPKKRAGRR